MKTRTQWAERFPTLSRIAAWPRPVQLGAASVAVTVVICAFLWAGRPDYRVLFANLEDRDGGAIVTALEQMNVSYRLAGAGQAIMVPADKVHEARLLLAQKGLPRSGETGFGLLDQTRFGASQFSEQVTYQRALEGELAQSVEALHAVQRARVHLALPRESLFVRERQPPTASVLLTLYPGRSLTEAQVSAITWLVSSSVPHLDPQKVSVVDQNGRLLTPPSGEAGADGSRRNLVNDIEQRTVQKILALLSPLVGPENVRAQVSADVDFVHREQTSETYRPNQLPGEAAVRSKQTSASAQTNTQPPQGVPGALTNQPPVNAVAPIQTPPPAASANNAPGNPTALAVTGVQQQGSGSTRDDATINYEVDRTISHTKNPLGTLRRLSVAVVVNYRQLDDKAEPLPADELDRLTELVRQAIGYSEERGDTLSVINSAFNEGTDTAVRMWQDPVYLEYGMRLIRYLLIALGLYLVWRAIIKPLLAPPPVVAVAEDDSPVALTDAQERDLAEERLAGELSRYEENLNTARTLAEKDPRAVAMVLRTWMEKSNDNG